MKSSLLYPSRCIFCGQPMVGAGLICTECAKLELVIRGKICGFCGVGRQFCTCGKRHNHYARRIACVYYKDTVRYGMSRFKFHRHTMLGTHFGKMMAENVKSKYQNVDFDAIIPVPMHWFNRWRRGYNCSELLAQEISNEVSVPVLRDILYKRSMSKPQKRIKGRAARAANVLDTFGIKNKETLQGKTVLLVDDVCTSGATINECAKMLRLYGAQKVYVVTFAAVAFTHATPKDPVHHSYSTEKTLE